MVEIDEHVLPAWPEAVLVFTSGFLDAAAETSVLVICSVRTSPISPH